MRMAVVLWLAGWATAVGAQDRPPDFQYAVDLSAIARTATVDVPDDRNLDILFANLVPAATYRVSQTETWWAVVPPLRTRDLGPVRFFRFEASPACSALQGHFDALQAAKDEGEVASQAKAMQEVLDRLPCTPVDKSTTEGVLRQVRPSLRESRRLSAGWKLVVTVERLGLPPGDTARRWEVTFRGVPADYGWKHPTEHSWIVASVATHLTKLAWFAARRQGALPAVTIESLAEPGRVNVSVAVPGRPVTATVVLSPHAWSPEAYRFLAQGLREAVALKSPPSGSPPGGTAALQALTDLRATVLAEQSGRVARRLQQQPLDPAAHEEAALILGAFALREAAGPFSDTRGILCRMTAHLAWAQGRGDRPRRERRWAEIVLSTLVGRQREALDALAALPPPQGPESAWVTALNLRNGQDWRSVKGLPERTLLERLEYFRAVTLALDASHALRGLQPKELEPVPDWGRMVAENPFSIDEGHRFVSPLLALELGELAQVLGVGEGGLPQLRQALADAHDPKAVYAAETVPEVLGRRDWSQAAARHVHACLIASHRFLRQGLSVPDQADAFVEAADQQFGSMPLYPLVARQRRGMPPAPGPDKTEQEFCTPLRSIAKSSPELLTASNWDLAHRQCAGTTGFPAPGAWFRPVVPEGTTLDAHRRLLVLELNLALRPLDLQQWRAHAPSDVRLLDAALQKQYQGKVPVEVIEREIGPLAEYHVRAMRSFLAAYAGDPAAYRRMAERLCALSADHCSALGEALRRAGLADDAAKAYQRAVDHALDRVGVATQSDWLVGYYQDRGQADKALAIAKMAAETYSRPGLSLLARLLERQGRYAEAESWYGRIRERYDAKGTDLLNFYMRVARRPGGEGYAQQAEAAKAKVFPQGLEPVALQALGSQPVPGAVLVTPSEALTRRGIRAGDTVVALDGYRVRSLDEYGSIKALRDDPTMRLIVWHAGAYLEVEERRDQINYFRIER